MLLQVNMNALLFARTSRPGGWRWPPPPRCSAGWPRYECSNPIHQRARKNGNGHHWRGCFCADRPFFQRIPGVKSVVAAMPRHGGQPHLRTSPHGTTGHAEVIQLTYDPAVLSYARCWRFSGGARSDDAEPAGERRWHAIPLDHPLQQRRAKEGRRGFQDKRRQTLQGPDCHPDCPLKAFYSAEAYHRITIIITRMTGRTVNLSSPRICRN